MLTTGSLAKAGGREAVPDDFDQYVATRGQALLRLAYVLTGDPSDAEDVVQDVLARALPRWSRIIDAEDPDAYLRRMLVNANVSRWRRFRRRETPFAEITPDGSAPDAADVAVAGSENDRLWRAVLALPKNQRSAVTLRFHEDLSYAEIGTITGCAEATARSHVFRGLAALRAALGEAPTDEGEGA